MINDETNWHILNQGFCAFKVKVTQPAKTTFCRNPHNVTGSCNRVSCPLANSEYATVIEKDGLCYLYVKTAERAHTPKKMWEKIELSKNYLQAVKQIDDELLYWADHKKNRCKQRLTKIRQMLLRQRKMVLHGTNENLVSVKTKTERREAVREAKAEKAAQLELAIEKELLERLKQGTYGDLYNYDSVAFEKMLDEAEVEEEKVKEKKKKKSLNMEIETEEKENNLESNELEMSNRNRRNSNNSDNDSNADDDDDLNDLDINSESDERDLNYMEGSDDDDDDDEDQDIEGEGLEDIMEGSDEGDDDDDALSDISDEDFPDEDLKDSRIGISKRKRSDGDDHSAGDIEDILGSKSKKNLKSGKLPPMKKLSKVPKKKKIEYEREIEYEPAQRERLLN